MYTTVIVVPAAPHYRCADGIQRFWPGRVMKAIWLSRFYDCPIIFAGDGHKGERKGEDLHLSKNLAIEAGVPEDMIFLALNALDAQHTRGDAMAAAGAITQLNEALDGVQRVIVATCWYHTPRFYVAMHQALRQHTCKPPRLQVAPVWDHFWHGTLRLLSPTGEIRGTFDYLRGSRQISRGVWAKEGKPGFQQSR